MRKNILFILLLLAACNLPATQEIQSPIEFESPQSAQIFATSTSTSPGIPARETYKLNTVVDYDRHSLIVEETIIYPNHTGETLNSLTLAIAANLWPNCFNLT